MNTLNERIKKVRKALDLTQQEFADRLGTARNNIAGYETSKRSPSEAVISLICKTFNVNETWLRTGMGEMFIQQSKEDELNQVFSAIAASDDELIKRIIRAYWRLDDKEKAAVKKLIDGFSADAPGSAVSAFAPTPAPGPELTVEQEADEFAARAAALAREQFLTEKKMASQASSAKESGSA